ncbi:hypothetical protein IT570_12255 [Candidatus Sumerlaeota bacterium]|nr:hypothetical protein [Candidatus Sumerlaeota bacterium]
MSDARDGSSPPLKKFLNKPAGSFLFCLLMTLLVFHRALWNEYAYDGAEVMRRLGTPARVPISVLWQPANYGEATGVMSWRPLSLAVFMLVDRDLFQANAALSHALNLLLHAVNGWLLLLLARRLGMRWAAALFAAALFLVHPLVSEVVLCAGFRFDVLAVLFSLATIHLTMSACAGPRFRWGFLAGASATFLLGFAAKENAVLALPLAVLVAQLVTRSRAVTGMVGCALGAIAAGFITVWMLFRYHGAPLGFMGGGGRLLGMGNFLVAFKEVYFTRFLVPWPMRIDHEFMPVASFADWRMASALLVGVLLAMAGIIGSRWRRPILLGSAWVVCGFATVSQVVAVPDPVAERFCYLPMVGAALVAGELLGLMMQSARIPHQALVIASCVFLAALGLLGWRRSLDWKDDVTLNIANWEQPGVKSAKARLALGGLYLTRAARAHDAGDEGAARGWEGKSEENLRVLVESADAPAEALRMAGVTALMRGEKERARELAARALALEPENPQVQKLAVATGLSSGKK